MNKDGLMDMQIDAIKPRTFTLEWTCDCGRVTTETNYPGSTKELDVICDACTARWNVDLADTFENLYEPAPIPKYSKIQIESAWGTEV